MRACYDKPRLLHRVHVCAIIEEPILKDGSGKELCRLHDNLNQHLQTLRAMNYEPSGPFIMAVIELKLDQTTMFAWQMHSQESPDVPHYKDLLIKVQRIEDKNVGNRALWGRSVKLGTHETWYTSISCLYHACICKFSYSAIADSTLRRCGSCLKMAIMNSHFNLKASWKHHLSLSCGISGHSS